MRNKNRKHVIKSQKQISEEEAAIIKKHYKEWPLVEPKPIYDISPETLAEIDVILNRHGTSEDKGLQEALERQKENEEYLEERRLYGPKGKPRVYPEENDTPETARIRRQEKYKLKEIYDEEFMQHKFKWVTDTIEKNQRIVKQDERIKELEAKLNAKSAKTVTEEIHVVKSKPITLSRIIAMKNKSKSNSENSIIAELRKVNAEQKEMIAKLNAELTVLKAQSTATTPEVAVEIPEVEVLEDSSAEASDNNTTDSESETKEGEYIPKDETEAEETIMDKITDLVKSVVEYVTVKFKAILAWF